MDNLTQRRSWATLGVILLGLAALWLWGNQRCASLEKEAQELAAASVREQTGLLVWLFDNPFLMGKPLTSRRAVPNMHMDRSSAPHRPYPFSWRWMGALHIEQPGKYLIRVHACDAVRLRIDGRRIIERWIGAPPRNLDAFVYLEAGTHLFDLQNVQTPERLDLALLWAPPGAARIEPIPAKVFSPLDEQLARKRLSPLNQAADQAGVGAWVFPLFWLILAWLAAARPLRAWGVIKEHRWFLVILALAGALRMLWGETVHGLCGESAYFMWRAELILEGARPFVGMNERVGPLFDYLLAPLAGALGPSVWLLRLSGAGLNLLALVFCYRVVSREMGRPTGVMASLILAVLPGLVMFARMPVETAALGPLFMFLGLDLLSLSRQSPWLSLVAGLVWGLASFNHPIFTMVPFCLVIAAALVTRLRILGHSQFWGLGLGVALGFLPRILHRILAKPRDVLAFFDVNRMADFWGFQWSFLRALDGENIFKTLTGAYPWPTYGIFPLALLAAVGVLLWGAIKWRDHTTWLELTLVTALGIHLIMTPLGAPTAQPRYYIFCLFWSGLIVARAWVKGFVWVPQKARRYLLGGLAGLVLVCLTSLSLNYFRPHLTTGGRPMVWESKLMDFTSDAWMNHKPLALELARRGYSVVATADYWHHTLDLALNLYQGRPQHFQAVNRESRSNTEQAAVFYNSPEGRERMTHFVKAHNAKHYERRSLGSHLDQKYLLLERKAPPVTFPQDLGGLW